MANIQIGFVGILSETDLIHSIDNANTMERIHNLDYPIQVKDLPAATGGLYTWEGGYLYTEVKEEEAQQQLLSLEDTDGKFYEKTSQDFFGGRPPTID